MSPGSGMISRPSLFKSVSAVAEPMGADVSGSLTSKLIAVAVLQPIGDPSNEPNAPFH